MVVALSVRSPADVTADVGRAAKALRRASGLTRRELAARSGVPAPTIRRFEETGLAPFLTVARIAEGLGRNGEISTLFGPSDTLPATLEEALAQERTTVRARR